MAKSDEHPRTLGRKPSPSAQGPFERLKALLSERRQHSAVTEDHILSVLLIRRARTAVFGTGLFSDPAWDLMLELYAAKLGERMVCLTDLAQAIDAPQSTTARWIAALNQQGFTESCVDPVLPSRISISLTSEGVSKMERLIDRWLSAFVSI